LPGVGSRSKRAFPVRARLRTEGVSVTLDAATVTQITGNTASDGAAFDNIVGPYTLT
jgi:hypothetical protein